MPTDIEENLIQNDPTMHPRLQVHDCKTFWQSFCLCIFLPTLMLILVFVQISSTIVVNEINDSSSS